MPKKSQNLKSAPMAPSVKPTESTRERVARLLTELRALVDSLPPDSGLDSNALRYAISHLESA